MRRLPTVLTQFAARVRWRSSRLASGLMGLAALAMLLAGVNIIADRGLAGVKLDATAQGLYSLSDGTRRVVGKLREPVTLRLYYSRGLGAEVPVYGAFADRVREMLKQYAALSDGRIRVELLDPEPFSLIEDKAVAAGLTGLPLDRSGEKIYFGLVGTNLLDDQRIIPFFRPERERFLEFDLTRLVHELSDPRKPMVGVMSALPLDGEAGLSGARGAAPWVLMEELRTAFDVQRVATDALVIPADVQVLLLAHPQNLSDATLYAIDQFVMRGGRLMAMVDPLSEAQAALPDPETGGPRLETGSALPRLFDAWGVRFDPQAVVGSLDGAWRVRAGTGERAQGVDYVPWFNIRAGIAHDDPATADLAQVTVASAGALGPKPGSEAGFTPLLTTTGNAGLLKLDDVRITPDPARLLAGFQPDNAPKVVAARLRAPLRSAFAGPPEPPKGQSRPADFPAYRAQTIGPANLVLVADSDVLADRFWVRMQDVFGTPQPTPFSDNGAFVANMVGTLAGGDDLIGLRGRGASLRPFDVVEDMEREAAARFRRSEQALQAHLDETENKLASLRSGKPGDAIGPVPTREQRAAIEDLRRDITETRGKLRAVQRDLRREVSALEMRLRLLNIVLVPALLAVAAIALSVVRRRRRNAARAMA